jgi:hypothetical protein
MHGYCCSLTTGLFACRARDYALRTPLCLRVLGAVPGVSDSASLPRRWKSSCASALPGRGTAGACPCAVWSARRRCARAIGARCRPPASEEVTATCRPMRCRATGDAAVNRCVVGWRGTLSWAQPSRTRSAKRKRRALRKTGRVTSAPSMLGVLRPAFAPRGQVPSCLRRRREATGRVPFGWRRPASIRRDARGVASGTIGASAQPALFPRSSQRGGVGHGRRKREGVAGPSGDRAR